VLHDRKQLGIAVEQRPIGAPGKKSSPSLVRSAGSRRRPRSDIWRAPRWFQFGIFRHYFTFNSQRMPSPTTRAPDPAGRTPGGKHGERRGPRDGPTSNPAKSLPRIGASANGALCASALTAGRSPGQSIPPSSQYAPLLTTRPESSSAGFHITPERLAFDVLHVKLHLAGEIDFGATAIAKDT